MESTTTTNLSIDEIRTAIKYWLEKTKGIEVTGEIDFDFTEEYDSNDWQARNPPYPVLSGASFYTKKSL